MEIGREQTRVFEEEVREKMELWKGAEVYMSGGRRVDWRDLGSVQADNVVEIGLMLTGGRMKKKIGNPGRVWRAVDRLSDYGID